MYRVDYFNGTTSLIDSTKAERALLLQKQGMLNPNQQIWFSKVKEITELRQAPDHLKLVKTKDMQCNCNVCLKHKHHV